MSIFSIEKLFKSDKDYLHTKFNNLVNKQEREREREKEKEKEKQVFLKKNRKEKYLSLIGKLKQPTKNTSESPEFQQTELKQIQYEESPKLSNQQRTFNFLDSLEIEKPKKTEKFIFPASPNNNKESLNRVTQIVSKTQSRYKLKPINKEVKFNENIKEFTKLDTFINVKTLLQEINIINPIKNQEKPNFDHQIHGNQSFHKDTPESHSEIEEEEEEKNFDNFYSVFPNNRGLSQKTLLKCRELERKKLKPFLTDEVIEKNLEISSSVTKYLNKGLRKETIGEFEEILLEDFKNNDFKLIQQSGIKSRRLSISQEMNLAYIKGFVTDKLKQNTLKSQLGSGLYFEKYRNQAKKILEILRKTTKNIYSNKVANINNILQDKNKKNLMKNKLLLKNETSKKNELLKSQITDKSDFSKIDKNNALKTFRKSIIFLTEENSSVGFEKNLKIIKDRRSISNQIPDSLPNIKEKFQKSFQAQKNFKSTTFLKNKIEIDSVKEKIDLFIKECDQTKAKLLTERIEDLKEIEVVKLTIDNGLEKVKGEPTEIFDGLKMITDKNQSRQLTRKKKKGSSYLSIGSIVSLM